MPEYHEIVLGESAPDLLDAHVVTHVCGHTWHYCLANREPDEVLPDGSGLCPNCQPCPHCRQPYSVCSCYDLDPEED